MIDTLIQELYQLEPVELNSLCVELSIAAPEGSDYSLDDMRGIAQVLLKQESPGDALARLARLSGMSL